MQPWIVQLQSAIFTLNTQKLTAIQTIKLTELAADRMCKKLLGFQSLFCLVF